MSRLPASPTPLLDATELKRLSVSDIKTRYELDMRRTEWIEANFNTLLEALPDIIKNSSSGCTPVRLVGTGKTFEIPNPIACLDLMIKLAVDDEKKEALARKIEDLKNLRDHSHYTFSNLIFKDESNAICSLQFLLRHGSWKAIHAILKIPYDATPGSTEPVGKKYSQPILKHLLFSKEANPLVNTTDEVIPTIDLLLTALKTSSDFYRSFPLQVRDASSVIGEKNVDLILQRIPEIPLQKIRDMFKAYKELDPDGKKAFLADQKSPLKTIFSASCDRLLPYKSLRWPSPEEYITGDKAEWSALIELLASAISPLNQDALAWLDECRLYIRSQPEAAAAAATASVNPSFTSPDASAKAIPAAASAGPRKGPLDRLFSLFRTTKQAATSSNASQPTETRSRKQ